MEDFLLDAQQSASTLGEENKRLLDARRREQERWEEERAQSKHIVQEMETEVGGGRKLRLSYRCKIRLNSG